MPQTVTLSKIGSRIKINLDKVKDRISINLIKKISSDPRATVIDYKMTDGTGIGLILELSDGSKSWFFDDEIGRS